MRGLAGSPPSSLLSLITLATSHEGPTARSAWVLAAAPEGVRSLQTGRRQFPLRISRRFK